MTEATSRHDAGDSPDPGEPSREANPGGSAIVDTYLRRTPGSAALQKRSEASMPGGASRALGHWLPYPVAFDRGEGADLIDVDRNRYLDLNNNFASLIHGHAYPPVTAAVAAQLRRGSA